MELRKSSNLHYINAIKGNMVRKLCNVDYRGKPAVKFKNLRDIYERDEAYRLEPSNPQRSQKSKRNEVVCQVANKEVGRDSEEHDFGKTTLKQLKEKCKSKKRKRSTSIGLNPEECGVKSASDQDDSDLMKPLSSFRVKLPKAKKNCVRAAPKSADVGISEPTVASSADDFPSINLKDESSSDKVIPYQIPATTVCQTSKRISSPEEYESPILNEASYGHLEDVEISSQIHEETGSSHFLDFPINKCDPDYVAQPLCMILPTMDQNSEIIIFDLAAGDFNNNMDYLHGECPLILENDIQESAFPDLQIVAVSHPTIEFSASQSSNPYSNPHEELFSMEECPMEEQHLICNYANRAATNCLDTGMHLVLSEEKSTLDEQGQPSTSNNLSQQGDFQQDCISADSPTSVPVRPPERLLLTRKVLSPTSEEQLSLALNSEQLHGHGDNEGDLCLGKKGGVHASSVDSECKNVDVAEIPQGSSSVTQTNGIISHPGISRIPKNVQNSSPKGNLEGPTRLSRFLPNVDTGCTSFQGCSESAIAFSQRQMQDMHSLTMKLMTGLKSIKDVLEKKCLFEACRRITTTDAEEVMKALKNATKVEETTKKQLSMLTRDCNRFCKIMSLAQEDTAAACAASNNTVQRERKKIVFADEAGGELCHVKLFKD